MSVVLEVKNLSKKYGSRAAVDDISFQLRQGEVVGFLGPNGAGKTTTMRMIAGLIAPTSGEVKLLEQPVPGKNLKFMGAMIEEPSFYPYLSGRDNLRYAAKLHGNISENRINETLELTGMKSRANDRVAKYSQGMRQRLGLARALLSSPKLLMLDEPANGLDPEGIAELREVIKHFGEQGITVFVSSHILAEVEKFAPRVLIINKGKLLRDGTTQNLASAVPATGADVQYFLETSDAQKAFDILRREPYIYNLELRSNGLALHLPQAAAYRLAPLLVQGGVMFTELSRQQIAATNSDLESLYLEVIGDQGNAGGVK
ncbi:MAG: ABC transporter ATP-binding protein [Deinococcales bacterium]